MLVEREWLLSVLAAVVGLAALLVAALAQGSGVATAALVVFALCVLAIFWLIKLSYDRRDRELGTAAQTVAAEPARSRGRNTRYGRTAMASTANQVKPATAQEVRAIVGPLDDLVVTQILATGATEAEVLEAYNRLYADDYIGGDLQRPATGRVGQVFEVLQAELQPDEDLVGEPGRGA